MIVLMTYSYTCIEIKIFFCLIKNIVICRISPIVKYEKIDFSSIELKKYIAKILQKPLTYTIIFFKKKIFFADIFHFYNFRIKLKKD